MDLRLMLLLSSRESLLLPNTSARGLGLREVVSLGSIARSGRYWYLVAMVVHRVENENDDDVKFGSPLQTRAC